MGFYINPTRSSKEEWLIANQVGQLSLCDIPNEEDYNRMLGSGNCIVCLVDNISFTAALIAYNYRELCVVSGEDGRDREFYIISKSKAIEVCPKVKNAF